MSAPPADFIEDLSEPSHQSNMIPTKHAGNPIMTNGAQPAADDKN